VYHTREGHRPDLSTLPSREAFRSRHGGAEIGSKGPLGRFLVRGEEGHDIIPELYPIENEVVVDKPMRSAFSWTDFDLLLRNAGVRNLVVSC
jgi:nicotinamidase-related amidase